jgi:hypothetical protein
MGKSLRCYDLWAVTAVPKSGAAASDGIGPKPAGNGWVAERLKAPVLRRRPRERASSGDANVSRDRGKR